MGLNLDAWWDEPEYKKGNTFHLRGLFILRKLREHDPARLQDVLADLYRDDMPDPQDIGAFEWQTILAYMGANDAACDAGALALRAASRERDGRARPTGLH
jgi:hypothetical protein